jgi:hypothetical protein
MACGMRRQHEAEYGRARRILGIERE